LGSVKELVKAIQEYIKSWNKDSKPFKWTKSAMVLQLYSIVFTIPFLCPAIFAFQKNSAP
jgi:hypothetical protein